MKVQQAHNQTQNMNIMEKENIICGVSYRYKKNHHSSQTQQIKITNRKLFLDFHKI